MLNITTGTIIISLAMLPELFAIYISLRGYVAKKYPHFLYMGITWFFLFIGTFLLALSYLFIDTTLYRLAIIANAPLTFSIMLLVDSVSRKNVDPWKLFVVTIVSTCIVVFATDSNAVVIIKDYFEEKSPAMYGRFDVAGSALFVLSGFFWLYYMAKIYINAPKSIKRDSLINLLGAVIAGPGAALAFASGLVWILPGTDYACIAIGSIITTYAFYKQPKLGYVLPFKVYRLITINSNSGITLYSYDWEKEHPLDDQLFSAALTGICSILNESLGKGIIREIEFEQGLLILQQLESYPIFFVLISNESRPILNNALQLFSKAFIGTYPLDVVENIMDTKKFEKSEEIVKETFPFVVEYN